MTAAEHRNTPRAWSPGGGRKATPPPPAARRRRHRFRAATSVSSSGGANFAFRHIKRVTGARRMIASRSLDCCRSQNTNASCRQIKNRSESNLNFGRREKGGNGGRSRRCRRRRGCCCASDKLRLQWRIAADARAFTSTHAAAILGDERGGGGAARLTRTRRRTR